MDDVLTDMPPPSRFFEEDLNIFTPPSPSLPSPSIVLSDPNYVTKTLTPSLLIFAMSPPSLHIFHHASSKKLIGTLILPEIPSSENIVAPTSKNKSCNIYALNDTEKLVLVISVEFPVPTERCHAVSKVLLTNKIVPERVLILDSIQIKTFRGKKLSRDDTAVYKLETSSEKKGVGESTLLKDMDYFPSGSVVDGLAAALLSQCQIRNIRGTLCVSWPQYGKPVMHLIKSLLVKHVLPDFDFTSTTSDSQDESLKSKWLKDPLLDSDMYA